MSLLISLSTCQKASCIQLIHKHGTAPSPLFHYPPPPNVPEFYSFNFGIFFIFSVSVGIHCRYRNLHTQKRLQNKNTQRQALPSGMKCFCTAIRADTQSLSIIIKT